MIPGSIRGVENCLQTLFKLLLTGVGGSKFTGNQEESRFLEILEPRPHWCFVTPTLISSVFPRLSGPYTHHSSECSNAAVPYQTGPMNAILASSAVCKIHFKYLRIRWGNSKAHG